MTPPVTEAVPAPLPDTITRLSARPFVDLSGLGDSSIAVNAARTAVPGSACSQRLDLLAATVGWTESTASTGPFEQGRHPASPVSKSAPSSGGGVPRQTFRSRTARPSTDPPNTAPGVGGGTGGSGSAPPAALGLLALLIGLPVLSRRMLHLASVARGFSPLLLVERPG
jgi:hypothetical protein